MGGDTYRITATLYRDCRQPSQGGGNPSAIFADNPLNYTIFDKAGNLIISETIESYNSTIIPSYSILGCGANLPDQCVNRIIFSFNKILPNNSSGGYTIVSQSCCWGDDYLNFTNSGGTGQSLICNINTQISNNSAVFNNMPTLMQCINFRDDLDVSATDKDGDSLSYSFCPVIQGGSVNSPKPVVTNPPPYPSIGYIAPYSAAQPYIHGQFSLNAQTGIITSQPTIQGRFLIGICCSEWRNGVLINESRRDIGLIISSCEFNNKAIIGCDSITKSLSNNNFCLSNCSPENRTILFENKSIGGTSYLWDFGVANSSNDTSTQENPTYTFPANGDYQVTLTSFNSDCTDSTKVMVHIGDIEFRPTLSNVGSLCLGQEIMFNNTSSDTIYQAWTFEYPFTIFNTKSVPYKFIAPGNKTVWLHTGNDKGCYNSVSKEITITDIIVKTISDTIMPRGSQLQINTTGANNYSWSYLSGNTSVYLNNTNIGDPIAIADQYQIGLNTFEVAGTDATGCQGKDTLNINVTTDAYFIIPNAFTPNGDGLNDYLSILLSGYSFNYIKIYNRRGQCLFTSNSLTNKWDGKFKGQEQAIDAYYWVARAYDTEAKEVIFKGDVTIIR